MTKETEPRSDRLARIKRALELGMPPLSTEDQRWLFEQVPEKWRTCCGWTEELDGVCRTCGKSVHLTYHTLAPPRKRCAKCGGSGEHVSYRWGNIVKREPDVKCDQCGGNGYEKEESNGH